MRNPGKREIVDRKQRQTSKLVNPDSLIFPFTRRFPSGNAVHPPAPRTAYSTCDSEAINGNFLILPSSF